MQVEEVFNISALLAATAYLNNSRNSIINDEEKKPTSDVINQSGNDKEHVLSAQYSFG